MDARVRAEYTPPACERTPPPAPLPMPRQKLSAPRQTPAQPQRGRWRLPFVVGVGLLAAICAVALGARWFARGGVSPVEALALALTFVNVFWIAAAAVTAIAGAVILWGRRAAPSPARTPAHTRTALIFPVYNEDFRRVAANAEALKRALDQAGELALYEFFFLSDSNARHAIETERATFFDLVMRHPGAPFYYRRRPKNFERKVGNIADFITKWGARYDFMVVFDADSVMTPEALAELTARMAASPQTAIIQTVPKIINARSRYARMQQFALNTYGPLFGAGMAWWSGDAGNYWGHNAIVRVSAFARHAGLPSLPGAAPFGGPILSHDFIEAAMLRRAGWRIEMAPDIEGSYEQVPPTLIDAAARDRRWAQGNLQHLRLLFARGFDWVSRAHILSGIMGYLSSAVWLALVLIGLGMALSGGGGDHRAGWLAGIGLATVVTAALLAPKVVAVWAWACGKLPGAPKDAHFIASVIAETIVSAAIAPILMANQTAAVVAALTGRDIGWREQVRDRAAPDLAEALRWFAPHKGAALLFLGVVTLLSPMAGLWAAPTMLSLIGSAFISHELAKNGARAPWLWRTAPPARYAAL